MSKQLHCIVQPVTCAFGFSHRWQASRADSASKLTLLYLSRGEQLDERRILNGIHVERLPPRAAWSSCFSRLNEIGLDVNAGLLLKVREVIGDSRRPVVARKLRAPPAPVEHLPPIPVCLTHKIDIASPVPATRFRIIGRVIGRDVDRVRQVSVRVWGRNAPSRADLKALASP